MSEELILGIGQRKSLWTVVHEADTQLKRTRGACRTVVARSHRIEVRAKRPKFDGEFNVLTVRLPHRGINIDRIREGAGQGPVPGVLTDTPEAYEIAYTVPPTGEIGPIEESLSAFSKVLQLPEIWRVHGEQYHLEPLSVEGLFAAMVKFKASDVHLYPGDGPVFRVDNQLHHSQTSEAMSLSAEQIMTLIHEIAPERDWKEFQEKQQCSFIFHQVGLGYARVSALIKADVPHLTMRFLPETIPSFEALNMPAETFRSLAELRFGLILVTGMTGSGKSTTVASLVDWINAHKSCHVLCIEDPVEYVHNNKKAVVSQRDVGVDIASFNDAVRGALRHDPDVIVIGEMRDPDTIRAAINAAATGHLVISTLHASTASEVVNRIVSFFAPVERDLVRLQLRDALRCVICQRLLPRIGGGRLPGIEVMFNDTKHIADGVMGGDSIGIKVGMQQTSSESFIFEKYLFDLAKQDLVSWADARSFASEPSIFDQMKLGTYVIPSVDSMLQHH